MPWAEEIAFICWLVGVSFWAGKAYSDARRTRKDLNGVRQIVDAHVDLTRQRFLHTIIVLISMHEGKDPKVVLDLLRRDVG
jgi:hypothetical protein